MLCQLYTSFEVRGLSVKLVKATSYDAFEAEVNAGIQMRNTNAVGFAKLLGFKRNFDLKQGGNRSVANAIVYRDVGRYINYTPQYGVGCLMMVNLELRKIKIPAR